MFFLLFHLQQEIVEALDDAARKYYEETPELEKTSSGVTIVTRVVAKAKQHLFKGQFAKYILQLRIPSLVMSSWMRSVSFAFILLNFLSNIVVLSITFLLTSPDYKALEQQ
jgi:hypothetical protein